MIPLRCSVLLGTLLTLRVFAAAADEPVSFNQDIRPILSDNCFACHGSDAANRKAKLRLDQAEAATADRRGVRAIAPRDLANSELWARIVSTDPEEVMPPPDSHKPPLKPEQRALLKRWIEQGAIYQNHWAYEPLRQPAPPTVAGTPASLPPIDRLVAATLARHKLKLAPEAPREVLLRRLTLDLTGLPPTPAELDAFLADRSPDAYDRAVTRLLASPRYGEHFGRHWLDTIRYADTHGLHLDNVRNIWPYRDWVVRSFNANQPFNQFTIEQLAGDQLPHPTVDQLIATGYNRSHLTTSEGGAIEAEAEARNTSDRTDTTATVWLGLTANCATCHDHKFDPLTQREYYSLGAFFKGLADRVWDGNVRIPGPIVVIAKDAATQKRIDAVTTAIAPLEAALTARVEALIAAKPLPKPAKKPLTYDVIWAEDSDLRTPADFTAPAPAGQWREGDGVPIVGGKRALRVEGSAERPFNFTAGDVTLTVRGETRAFVHFNADPARPPRAVSLEFISEEKTSRTIWGDRDAFGPEVAKTANYGGPLPAPGAYAKLEIMACESGLEDGKGYSGLRLAQSDGAAWWDHVGAKLTTSDASTDPLLSSGAWATSLRGNARFVEGVPIRHDIKFLIGLSPTQQNEEEKERLNRYHRDYIYGPLRAEVEPEAHTVRNLLAEQIHYELTLPASLISRERAEPLPAHILIRGQYDKPGDLVTPATPAFLPPLAASGPRPTRLDLARWLVDEKNPLTARVTVNRFWQQLLGAGLVRTPGDFGAQGDPPTHPELLDWLAGEFVRTGWDVKNLVRLIVTSRTYRQSSDVTPQLLELDPANKLLARGPRLRLDGEVLRDQALLLSGLLVPAIGGPPVRPYQPINIWEPVAFGGSNTKTYVQDHGEALYRRSLYTFWKRTAPPPSMTTFDAPSRENLCTGRGRSDTPLQALALMNDVQQFEAARAFAERLLAEKSSDTKRLALAFRSVTSREPNATERTLLADTLATHRAHFAKNTADAEKVVANGESKPTCALPAPEVAAWTMVTNLLLNLDEAITRN
ncbi:MAG: PSD1 and planctomycete cytochrome C domain-containing protein [Verrucomicrobia bacterium]|nr:PSD1 and planctomycete cytochrome C domain-containing protein [Verrucomicrobiota bacterium]